MAGIHEEVEQELAVLKTLFRNAPVGVAFVDRGFRYLQINEILAASHALSIDAHIGRTVEEVVPDLWPALKPLYERALAGETILNVDASGRGPTGREHYWLFSYYPVRLADRIAGLGVIARDITERHHAEHALRVRNDLYAMLSRTSQAVNQCSTRDELFAAGCRIAVDVGRFCFAWIGVPDGNRIRLVASAGEDAGYIADVVISLDESDPQSQGPMGQAALTGRPFVVNDFLHSAMTAPWHAAAQRVGFGSTAALPLMERSEVVAVLTLYAPPGFFTDDLVTTLNEITPNVSFALDALLSDLERRRAMTDLQAVSARLNEAREQERVKMARDIHDHLGQALTALKMDVVDLGRRLDAGDTSVIRERLGEMSTLIDTSVNDVRRVASELRPVVLDDLGFIAAIRAYFVDVERRAKIRCVLSTPLTDLKIADDRATTLFRILQEALTNVVRHADAKRVDVSVAVQAGMVRLVVHDDGRGLPEAATRNPRSLGLVGMRDRARLFGGDVCVSGGPGEGTTVTVDLPIAGESA